MDPGPSIPGERSAPPFAKDPTARVQVSSWGEGCSGPHSQRINATPNRVVRGVAPIIYGKKVQGRGALAITPTRLGQSNWRRREMRRDSGFILVSNAEKPIRPIITCGQVHKRVLSVERPLPE
jgi:hypothetical protein